MKASELFTVLGVSVLNLLLWIYLLSFLPAIVVACITGGLLGLAISEMFAYLDRKRAKIKNTSKK